MLKAVAAFVDHPAVRVAAALVGLAGLAFLVLFGVVIALSPKTSWMLAVGAAGLVGQVGWWLRLVVSMRLLAAHPVLRSTVCLALATGIAAMAYTVVAWPDAQAWLPFLVPIGLTGVLLFLGSLASWQRPADAATGPLLRVPV